MSSSTSESGIAASAGLRSPRLPRVPHRLQLVAAAEPLVERGVHRHVEVRGDRELGRRRARSRRPRDGHTKMRHTISLSPPAGVHDAGTTFFTSSADSQLMIAPSPSRPARRSMPSRSAATRIGGCTSGTHAEPEALHLERVVLLRHLLARERGPQEAHHVAHPLVRLVERHAVPPLDDDVRRRADAEREAARRGRRPSLATDCAMHAGARVKAGTIAVPRRSAGAHCGGERERRERVGAVGLGRPHVGVAEVGELLVLRSLRVQRAAERHRHSGSDGQRHGAGRYSDRRARLASSNWSRNVAPSVSRRTRARCGRPSSGCNISTACSHRAV